MWTIIKGVKISYKNYGNFARFRLFNPLMNTQSYTPKVVQAEGGGGGRGNRVFATLSLGFRVVTIFRKYFTLYKQP